MTRMSASQVAVGVFLLGALAQPLPAATMEEDFSTDPAGRGWRTFGEASLFQWDAENQHLAVTWDSSQTNSYFHRPLGRPLSKRDDFSLHFDLRLTSVQVGVATNKPSTFELAIGLFELASATHPNFNRGTGRHSTNLVEFDYFPEFDVIAATVSPTIVSSHGQFLPVFSFPLELTVGDWFHVAMTYTASNQTLATQMTRNGTAFGPIKDVQLADYQGQEGFTDFRVDAVSINSYNDRGDRFGSLLAHGLVDNVVVMLPDPPGFSIVGRFENQTWQVQFSSRSQWRYILERSENFSAWTTTSASTLGTGGPLTLTDTNVPSPQPQFYRVRAESP